MGLVYCLNAPLVCLTMDKLSSESLHILDARMLGNDFGADGIHNLVEGARHFLPSNLNQPLRTLMIPLYRAHSDVKDNFT